jgi:hypothetical protein
MDWLSAVLGDFRFWMGTAFGVAGVLLLTWEQRRFSLSRQAREKDAHLRKILGY